jgi:hypothetical protein
MFDSGLEKLRTGSERRETVPRACVFVVVYMAILILNMALLPLLKFTLKPLISQADTSA